MRARRRKRLLVIVIAFVAIAGAIVWTSILLNYNVFDPKDPMDEQHYE